MNTRELINECREQVTYDIPYSTQLLLMRVADRLELALVDLNTAREASDRAACLICGKKDCKHIHCTNWIWRGDCNDH